MNLLDGPVREAALAALASRLEDPIIEVSYPLAEQLARQLATRIVQVVGADLTDWQVSPIPRGGYFVQGMLAYHLPPLSSPTRRPSNQIIVDDCALSGQRFRQHLRELEAAQILFATLYSPPELRQAIEREETRGVLCVAAEDLRDRAPSKASQAAYREWVDRQTARVPDAYWVGLPDSIVFPWSEPSRPFWNGVSERLEPGWQLFAPHRCLKNWSSLRLPPRECPPPRYLLRDDVAFMIKSDEVLLCRLASGAVWHLDGVAAEMWKALVGYGDLSVASAHLVETYSVDEITLQKDLENFVEELLGLNLIAEVSPGSSTPG